MGKISEINDVYFQHENEEEQSNSQRKLRHTNTTNLNEETGNNFVLFKNLSDKELLEENNSCLYHEDESALKKCNTTGEAISSDKFKIRRFTEFIPKICKKKKNIKSKE